MTANFMTDPKPDIQQAHTHAPNSEKLWRNKGLKFWATEFEDTDKCPIPCWFRLILCPEQNKNVIAYIFLKGSKNVKLYKN